MRARRVRGTKRLAADIAGPSVPPSNACLSSGLSIMSDSGDGGVVRARVRELSLSASALALRVRGVEKFEVSPQKEEAPGMALPPAEAAPADDVAVDLSSKAERLFSIYPFNPTVASRVLFVHTRQLEELRVRLERDEDGGADAVSLC